MCGIDGFLNSVAFDEETARGTLARHLARRRESDMKEFEITPADLEKSAAEAKSFMTANAKAEADRTLWEVEFRIHTREGEEGRLPPSSSLHTTDS